MFRYVLALSIPFWYERWKIRYVYFDKQQPDKAKQKFLPTTYIPYLLCHLCSCHCIFIWSSPDSGAIDCATLFAIFLKMGRSGDTVSTLRANPIQYLTDRPTVQFNHALLSLVTRVSVWEGDWIPKFLYQNCYSFLVRKHILTWYTVCLMRTCTGNIH